MSNQLNGLHAGTWNLDASHSEIGFTARHAGISKTRGSFSGATGTLTAGDRLEDNTLAVTIPVAGIDTRNADRDNHLRSADFFDAENHAELTFVSTSFDEDEIAGDLTMHGVSRPVTLETEFNGAATDPFGQSRAGFTASTTVNRKDFGLTWNAALETGGVLVSDKVKIEIDAEFVAPQQG